MYNTWSRVRTVMYIHVDSKRKRCGSCTGCTTTDCGKYQFCTDKPIFGGLGRESCCEKQKCVTLFSKGLYIYNLLSCKVYKYVPQYTDSHRTPEGANCPQNCSIYTCTYTCITVHERFPLERWKRFEVLLHYLNYIKRKG